MRRKCAICSSRDKAIIYTQKFMLPNKRKAFAYDVVVCRQCGFMFADNIPSQKEYEKYYRDSIKYTYSSKIPAGLSRIYRDLYSIWESVTTAESLFPERTKLRILDVGCSIGHFLHMFKERGFKFVEGIEPSQACSEIARKLYGIKVFPGTPAEFKSTRKFDSIVLTGVLEHISEFDAILPHVSGLLKESAILMVAVPNAGKFSLKPRAPFDEFSMEHINYFTDRSLSNLLARYGMKKICSETIEGSFYDTRVLVSFFMKSGEAGSIESDLEGISRMRRYIYACSRKLNMLEKKFDALDRSDRRVTVWGVGSLTGRLIATTRLARLKIDAFVDGNESLHGKKIKNIRIISPELFPELRSETVFIASHIYRKEIGDALRKKYKFKGQVIGI